MLLVGDIPETSSLLAVMVVRQQVAGAAVRGETGAMLSCTRPAPGTAVMLDLVAIPARMAGATAAGLENRLLPTVGRR